MLGNNVLVKAKFILMVTASPVGVKPKEVQVLLVTRQLFSLLSEWSNFREASYNKRFMEICDQHRSERDIQEKSACGCISPTGAAFRQSQMLPRASGGTI